jgi:Xaa-Pro aminopeptidase
MEYHQEPYIHDGKNRIIKPGMSFTVEPVIYLQEKYGVRIEDDVLITEDGQIIERSIQGVAYLIRES